MKMEAGIGVDQGTPRVASKHQKLEEAKDSPLEPSERAQRTQHLDLGLLASRTVRK